MHKKLNGRQIQTTQQKKAAELATTSFFIIKLTITEINNTIEVKNLNVIKWFRMRVIFFLGLGRVVLKAFNTIEFSFLET